MHHNNLLCHPQLLKLFTPPQKLITVHVLALHEVPSEQCISFLIFKCLEYLECLCLVEDLIDSFRRLLIHFLLSGALSLYKLQHQPVFLTVEMLLQILHPLFIQQALLMPEHLHVVNY